MAFPTIPTGGRVLTTTQANGTSPRTFPDLSSLTKNSGDLLLALITAYDTTAGPNAAFSSWGGGFTEFFDFGSSGVIRNGGAYKFSDGTETGTFTVAQAATITGHAAMILLSIPLNHPSTVPASGSGSGGVGVSPDPSNLTPSWGAEDNLWIAFAGIGETATSGAFTGLTTSPTNYSNDVLTAISADVVGGTQMGVGFRQLNAASEDAGAWTCDTSSTRTLAGMIAVRPVPPIQNVTPIHVGRAMGLGASY